MTRNQTFFSLALIALFGFAALRVFGIVHPPLVVGVITGPQAEVMTVVRSIAREEGLDFIIRESKDCERLNTELRAGAIDANSCQDLPTLDAYNSTHGQKLAHAAYTLTLPLGIYSATIRSLRELPLSATIAIPKDPASRGRTLILLHNYGLIDFRESAGLSAAPADITYNPRNLQFAEFDPKTREAAFHSHMAVALSYPDAEKSGLYPARDSIAMDDARSPYAQVLAVRAEDKEKPWLQNLIKAYHSEPVKEFILTRFQDSVRRPW